MERGLRNKHFAGNSFFGPGPEQSALRLTRALLFLAGIPSASGRMRSGKFLPSFETNVEHHLNRRAMG